MKLRKRPVSGIEGIPDEGEIAGSKFEGHAAAQFLQESAHHESAGVVVDGVTLAVIGHREKGMLQHAGLVGHVAQVVEFEGRSSPGLLSSGLTTKPDGVKCRRSARARSKLSL